MVEASESVRFLPMEAGYHIEFSDDMKSMANDGLNVNPLANFNSKLSPPIIRF